MPFVGRPGSIVPDTSRELTAEPVYPETNDLAADDDTALGKQVFGIGRAEPKPVRPVAPRAGHFRELTGAALSNAENENGGIREEEDAADYTGSALGGGKNRSRERR